jgi:flagellar protein FliS
MDAPATLYRDSEILTAPPAVQVVLLYRGAIRFGRQHLAALDRGDREVAHRASLRCQAIVAGLREALDRRAGPLAVRLDAIYDFVLRRLVEGNVQADPRPTREALALLEDLLEAWETVARGTRPEAAPPSVSPVVRGAA